MLRHQIVQLQLFGDPWDVVLCVLKCIVRNVCKTWFFKWDRYTKNKAISLQREALFSTRCICLSQQGLKMGMLYSNYTHWKTEELSSRSLWSISHCINLTRVVLIVQVKSVFCLSPKANHFLSRALYILYFCTVIHHVLNVNQ